MQSEDKFLHIQKATKSKNYHRTDLRRNNVETLETSAE